MFFRTNLIDLVLAAIATPFLSFQQGSGKDVHGVSFCFVFFRTNLIDLVLAAIVTPFLSFQQGSGKDVLV